MTLKIKTNRLILTELSTTHLGGMFELESDALVHQFVGQRPVSNREEALAVINHVESQYSKFGIGRFAVIEKATGDFIGWCGLKYITENINGHSNYYDLGYRILRRHWGKGFATESSIASLEYGFNAFGLNEIYAAAHVENHASIRILLKLGFRQTGVFQYDGSEHFWFELKKDDWNSVIISQNGPLLHSENDNFTKE